MTPKPSGPSRASRIGVIGWGVIGRRVAAAVAENCALELAGVAVRSPKLSLLLGTPRYPLFCESEYRQELVNAAVPITGSLDDLLASCDLVIDCTERGQAAARLARYRSAGVRVVVHGGEKHATIGHSFWPSVHAGTMHDVFATRIPSCNTVGICRVVEALAVDLPLTSVHVAITKSAADRDKAAKGDPIGIEPTVGMSHHSSDVTRFFPDIRCTTQAITAPTSRGHVLQFAIAMASPVSEVSLRALLQRHARITIRSVLEIPSTRALRTVEDREPDLHDVVIWDESIYVEKEYAFLTAAIHMEAVVIPETLDCIRALLTLPNDSAART